MNNFSTPTTKIKSRVDNVPWDTFIYSLVIFGAALMIYAGLRFIYKPFIAGAIKEIEARITSLDRSAPQPDMQEGFIQFYSQLTNIRNLLSNHIAITPLFNILEANTMENIGFSSMIINVAERTVNISGFAGSYESLAGQLAVYENIQGIDRVLLSSAKRAGELVQFDLRINIGRDLLTLATETASLENQSTEGGGAEPAAEQLIIQ